MKKILIFFFILFYTISSYAHPLDISSSFISFNKNYLNITTFFHPYEIDFLLNSKWIKTRSILDYYENENIIKKYIKENISLEVKNNLCKIENIEIVELEEYEILTSWLEINYNFVCEENIESWVLNVNFFDNFVLQTNQLTLYDLNDANKSNTPFQNIVLTSKITQYYFDLLNKNDICIIDTDWDWITDELELIYWTDPYNIDTDWNLYTDYEEIFNSWDPLDPNLWPEQEYRDEIPKDLLKQVAKNIKTKEDCTKEIALHSNQKQNIWLLAWWFWNEYFINTIKKISDYISKVSGENLFFILLLVVGLWFIHAMWPGHSKSLLISYILDKNKKLFDGTLYAFIFTITHIIDIIILFLFTKVIFNMYDISNYMIYIQRFSLIILFIFSIYLFIKAYKSSKIKSENICKKRDLKWSILMWFIAWIAPCTFWWSIFLLLFSTGNISLIIPMLIALWIWIFLCLFLIVIITIILRKKVFEKISAFSRYSSLISSLILMILSLYLFSIII